MLAEGTYTGTIESAVVEESKTGNETMTLTFEINNVWSTDTQAWETLEAPTTRDVFLSFSGKALDFTLRKLKTLSWNNDLEDPEFTDEAVELRMKVEQYEGKEREGWDLARWGRREIKKASMSKLKGLQARIKAAAPSDPSETKAPRPSTPKPKSSKPSPPPPKTADDADGEMSKEKAFSLCVDAMTGKTDEEINEQWYRCVCEVGDDETKFTADDWAKVAEAVKLPF